MAGRSGMRDRRSGVVVGTLGAALMAAAVSIATAQVAAAEPLLPVEPPPPPLELIEPAEAPLAPDAAPVAAPESDPLAPVDAAAPVEGVSHLPSPDSLPPGTTQTPPDSGRLGYLRDLLHAVRTQDVTMTDAFLLFAQRPVDTKSIAPGSMSPHPQTPLMPPTGPVLPEQAAPALEAGTAPALEAGTAPALEAGTAPALEAGTAEALLPVPPATAAP